MTDTPLISELRVQVDRGFAVSADVIAGLRESDSAITPDERRELLLIAALGEVYRFRPRSAADLVRDADQIVSAGGGFDVPTAWLRLNVYGQLASAEGRRSDALDLHRRALALAEGNGFNDGHAASLLAIGNSLLIEGDSAGAIEVLADLASRHVHDPMFLAYTHEFLADTLSYSGAHKLAREHYEDAIRTYSATALRARSRILRKLTTCLVELGDPAGARECLGAAHDVELVLGDSEAVSGLVGAHEMRILACERRFEAALGMGFTAVGTEHVDVYSADAAFIAVGQAYLALGMHDKAVALWGRNVAETMSADGASRLSSIVGQAFEAIGDFKAAVEIEEVNYANVRRRSLELAPLLRLAGQLESLVALRRRKSEINFAWSSGTDLVHEVEEVSDLLITEIDDPLTRLSVQFGTCDPANDDMDEWVDVALRSISELEDLLSSGMERANLSMNDLEVPADLVIERVCRRLDRTAVRASVKLHRGASPGPARSTWEHSDALAVRVGDAIEHAEPGSTVVVAADPDRSPPFRITVR